MTARFRLLLPRTCSFLASYPASWIDVQSLPRGYHFLVPIHQVRTYTSHQQISCVAVHLQPAYLHAFACFGLTDRTRRMMLEKGAVQSEQKVVSFLLQGGWILTLFEGRMWRVESDTLQKEHEDDTTTERSATDS